jgi:hypothetical protein
VLLAALAFGSGSAFGWHGPDPVMIQPGGDATRVPRIATNESGMAVAVWRQMPNESWIARAAVRTPGSGWDAPASLSAPDRDALSVDVALAPNGTAAAVWQSWDGSSSTIEAAVRAPGGSWEAPQALSSPVDHSFSPQVVIDDGGNITAVWASAAAPGVLASTRPAGGTWSTPEVVSYGVAYSVSADASGSGHVALGWRTGDGVYQRAVASLRPVGGAWSTTWLSAPGQDATSVDVSVDEAGNAFAVWERLDDRIPVIQYSQRSAGGAWTRPRELAPGTGPRRTVQLDTGAGGHTAAIWSSDGRVVAAFKPPNAGWGPASFNFYGRYPEVRVDRTGNFVVVSGGVFGQWKPVGQAWKDSFDLAPDIYDARDPDVGIHDPGRATAVWVRDNGAVQASSFDIDSGQEEEEDEIDGTDGDDELEGTDGDDVFRGFGGNDTIYGRGGNDVIYGGAGNDRLIGGRGDDILFGGLGRDGLRGGDGLDDLKGGPGRDTFAGQGGRDFLWARDGRRDRVIGGPGRDRFRVDRRLDKIDRLELPF